MGVFLVDIVKWIRGWLLLATLFLELCHTEGVLQGLGQRLEGNIAITADLASSLHSIIAPVKRFSRRW